MATVPVEDTLSAGTKILASWGNSDVRDAINFLLGVPRCKVQLSAAQSTGTTATFIAINWDAEAYDTDTMHDTVTNNSRVVATTAGLYHFCGTVGWNGNATGSRQVQFRTNAAGNPANGTAVHQVLIVAVNNNPNSVPFAFDLQMNATDYIEAFGWQSSGGSLALQTSVATTNLAARWVASS